MPAAIPPHAPGTSLWSEIGTALWDVVTAQNTGQYGIAGIITAAATIFFAYIGFEAVSTAGAESRNPKRDMPIGILGSLIICTILYILTSGGPYYSTMTLAMFAYNQGFGRGDIGFASAIGTVILVLMMIVTTLYLLVYRRTER